MKETEDFSPMDHIPSYSSTTFSLLSPVSHEGNRRFFPNGSYTNLLLSEFFLIISYSCTYPSGIEYAGTLGKVEVEIEIEIETKVTPRQELTGTGRDSDRR